MDTPAHGARRPYPATACRRPHPGHDHRRHPDRHRRPAGGRLAVITVLTGLLAALAPGAPAGAAPVTATDRPPIAPLPEHLEQIRAAEAVELYGSPEIRPLEQRLTSLVTMGDSEISGEGVGNYEPGTHGSDNWCDRSLDQALFRTGIPADERYNLACSGAEARHLVYGSGAHQYDELNQGDYLAIKARNTRIKLLWVVVGANGAGTIEFGPVATDCTIRRVFFLGPCYPTYSNQWAVRVDGSRQQVEQALASIRQTMTDAGYAEEDYELVLMSYPSPFSPDVEDNPDFPGWYSGGCLVYLHDAAFARNKAVPMFETALRRAALASGVRYLDASRLFHGHEVCTDNTWARGLFIELGVWDENAVRQSFHPNYRGHGAFAQCMTAFWNSGLSTATCVDPASTGSAVLIPGLLEFRQLRNLGTGGCVDGKGYNSRNGTVQQSYPCHGGRNQGFWYDPERRTLHSELSHDRCLDVKGGVVAAGRTVQIYDCHGGPNQQWTFAGDRVKPYGRDDLCLGFNNPLLTRPSLHLFDCGSSARQRWVFEERNVADPVGYHFDDFIGSRVY
ncbi:MAG: ricin-type beta-trefoil lectin domain protein [Micromonosporaceae bacterium]